MALKIEFPLIVLSDLHLGHPASMLERCEQIIPLLQGMKTVIFNGDTVELVSVRTREKAKEHLKDLEEACHLQGVRSIFLNGNHDPFLSEFSHLDLVDGAVLVTHGDIIFHKIAPWKKVGD
ncbi:MAG: metallophosphoesterase, partial [Nitrospinota bacterium]